MKRDELICCNGKMVRWSEAGLDINHLLGLNFVYQKIHALEHKPLHIERHIELASNSYRSLYGNDATLCSQLVATEIETILSGNRYPKGSAVVTLYLLPPAGDQLDPHTRPTQILCCEKQLLYKGYTHWHSSLKTAIVSYDYPYSEHQTAISLNAHNYANTVAAGQGADIAVAKSAAGVLTSVGGYPIFGIDGKSLYTPPLSTGVAQSVERLLGLASCRNLGLRIVEEAITEEMIQRFEEMFTVNSQGVVSIGSCGGRLFPASMAKNIANSLRSIVI